MMDFRQLLGGDMAMPAPGQDMESNDTAESVQISSLALLKVNQISSLLEIDFFYFLLF
jgi:26S proteasome regulatory subunit N11